MFFYVILSNYKSLLAAKDNSISYPKSYTFYSKNEIILFSNFKSISLNESLGSNSSSS